MSEKRRSGAYAFVDEFARQIEEKSAEFAGKYSVNEQNMDHFKKLCYLFHWIADAEVGGEVKRVDVSPESDRATISIEVPTFELRGNELKQFKDILQFLNTLDFTNTGADSVLIEASMLHVWDVAS